jgi:phosphatidylcholine synthase
MTIPARPPDPEPTPPADPTSLDDGFADVPTEPLVGDGREGGFVPPKRVGAAGREGGNQAAAWLVHLYTASGALLAFFGTVAVFEARYRDSLLCMMAATWIDATDGLFARRARVSEVLEHFDGARLDDIVDYLTFVFVPVLFAYHGALLPYGWDWLVASVVLLSSAYGFASTDAKTGDHFFTGFPSYWNIVVLYLYVADLAPRANAAILLVLSALVFVRIRYVYPSRTPVLRTLTVSAGVVWSIMLLAVVLALPERRTGLLAASMAYPVYYTVLSFALQLRRAPAAVARAQRS